MSHPLLSEDPLAPLLLPPRAASPGLAVRHRTGRIMAWDPVTGENTVRVDGVDVSNVSVLSDPYVGLITPGDSVSLMSTVDDGGIGTLMITGLALTPPDPRLSILRAAVRPPHCKLRQNTIQTSLNFAIMTNLEVEIDTDGMASGDRIIIQTKGVYYIAAGVSFALGTSGAGLREVGVRYDRAGESDVDRNLSSGYLPASPVSTGGISLHAAMTALLEVGDEVYARVSAPTGSNTVKQETWLQATYVGSVA